MASLAPSWPRFPALHLRSPSTRRVKSAPAFSGSRSSSSATTSAARGMRVALSACCLAAKSNLAKRGCVAIGAIALPKAVSLVPAFVSSKAPRLVRMPFAARVACGGGWSIQLSWWLLCTPQACSSIQSGAKSASSISGARLGSNWACVASLYSLMQVPGCCRAALPAR